MAIPIGLGWFVFETTNTPPPDDEGGVSVLVERHDILCAMAEEVDRVARLLHERIAYELDSLCVATP